jgi:hypothetical protein
MNTLSVPTVCAVFLASNLAQGRLTCGAGLVHHPVFKLVSAYSVSDNRNFFLWQSDWLSTSGTDVTAHRRLDPHHLFQLRSESPIEVRVKDSLSVSTESSQVGSIVFCDSTLLGSSE